MLKYLFSFIFLYQILSAESVCAQQEIISLAGQWSFQIDKSDEGIKNRWFETKLTDNINLPGSLTTNGKGDDITLATPWTGSIFDSSYFLKPEYAQYREPDNIKVPFWLQPLKYYKGAAWYQKTIDIPASWSKKVVVLFIERAHWETQVWLDKSLIDTNNSLSTPHMYVLPGKLNPGRHTITIRVDNRIKDVNVGQNSHSISDHTQTNWNGMIGRLELQARPLVFIDGISIYPDVSAKKILAKVSIQNYSGASIPATLQSIAALKDNQLVRLPSHSSKAQLQTGTNIVDIEYPLGSKPHLWNEFQPKLYELNVSLNTRGKRIDSHVETFGMREISSANQQFTVNGQPVFLRGTLECAIFPKTGFPAMDVSEWKRIFTVCKSYGLNHIRFHSWCPPRAAFEVADSMGFYLQVEGPSWANWGTSLGDGKEIDKYIYDETERIVKEYGNHPSFCLMTYGNEPGGKNHKTYLSNFVKHWKDKDNRRLYTSGAGWPIIPENDYHNISDPRIQHWEEGTQSIINSKPPSTDYDWSKITSQYTVPTVSHEIGQWCVFPDLTEITQYDGVLKAKNFEIFKNTLEQNRLSHLADSFLLASGKLQVLCYKSDIEAALRTKNFGGFQLLDLHDFPGQGTALVGVLNPFWKEKGYVTGQEFSQFCSQVVPLARFPKMIYLNNESLSVPVEVANFSGALLENPNAQWRITDTSGNTKFEGTFQKKSILLGNGMAIGSINQSLHSISDPSHLTVVVSVGDYQNSWDIFVYPAELPDVKDDILVTDRFDKNAIEKLNKGGKVLLSLKKGSLKPEMGGDVAVGFSSIFWNTAWTNGQAPHTLGIVCNPQHPALAGFPTQFHSNWQWWDAMSHSNAIRIDLINADLQPIVRVIDDWVTSRPLGLIFECTVGKGKLLVSGIDLLSDTRERHEARQLLHSLKTYMNGDKFAPGVTVNAKNITESLR